MFKSKVYISLVGIIFNLLFCQTFQILNTYSRKNKSRYFASKTLVSLDSTLNLSSPLLQAR